ncbi:MAG: fold, partial [Ilumatobacteraceae bacterium]|nr:fold [Ilumatobacteraceae bacterium]
MSEQQNSAAHAVLTNTKLVLDCLPRAIVILDLDAVIIGWNNVATRFYGWTESQAIGQSLDLVTPQRLRAAGRSILHSVFEGTT